MRPEEAIMPMRKAIKDAAPEAIERVHESVKRSKKGSVIVIVGVGNTSGVGNDSKSVLKAEKWVDQHEKKINAMKKKHQKKEGFL